MGGGTNSGLRNYDEEEISFMQKLADDGYTASETAAMFLEKFRRLITKNAVVGLWSRGRINRIPRQRKEPFKDAVKFDFKSRKRQKQPDPTAKARAERANAARILKMSDTWKPLEGFEPVALIDRAHTACRWPLDKFDSGGIRMSCGAPRYGESSYCPTHRHIGTQPARVR